MNTTPAFNGRAAPFAAMVRLRAAGLAVAVACASGSAWPQAHEQTTGAYTLRASVVSSMDIAEATAREHGLDRSPVHGVLNVTLLARGGGPAPAVPAGVEASITNLFGAHHSVDLREQRVGGWISYGGSFRHAPSEVLDFKVSAQPKDGGPRLELAFRERMGRRAGR